MGFDLGDLVEIIEEFFFFAGGDLVEIYLVEIYPMKSCHLILLFIY